MAERVKVLAQGAPPSGVLTTLYTVPASTVAIASSLTVCNRGDPTTFRVSVAVAGATDTAAQYVYYDVPLAEADTFIATIGFTLGATDVVRVYSASGRVSFNLFGTEVS